jgi:hypothetical protein
MSFRTHGKTIAELVGAVIMAAVVAYQELAMDGVTTSEWIMVAIAVLGVVNVWATANISGFEKAKTVVSALFVGLNLVVGFLTDGQLSGDEGLLLIIQVLSTLGVAAAPAPKHVVDRTVIKS